MSCNSRVAHSNQLRDPNEHVLHQRFRKSKKISTSNWAREQLTPEQLSYAANDAYAAIKVFHALNKPESAFPIVDLT